MKRGIPALMQALMRSLCKAALPPFAVLIRTSGLGASDDRSCVIDARDGLEGICGMWWILYEDSGLEVVAIMAEAMELDWC